MGNKPPKELLERWWLESLGEGLERNGLPDHAFRFELVYWAHHLHKFPYDPNLEDEDDPLFLSEPYAPSLGKPEPRPSELRRKALGLIERVIDKLLLNDDMTVNYKSITGSIIRKHFKDLEIYYSAGCVGEKDKGRMVRNVIRGDLLRALRKHKDRDILLIAHSMGSIIAYDVLTRDAPEVMIDTLVTLGSPLGLPVILSRHVQEKRDLLETAKPLTTPPNVLRHWYNLSDLQDRVAFNYDLADDYAPNAEGVGAEDKIVHNDYEVYGRPNHHKVYGYLRTKEMAQILHEFLTEERGPPLRTLSEMLRRTWKKMGHRIAGAVFRAEMQAGPAGLEREHES